MTSNRLRNRLRGWFPVDPALNAKTQKPKSHSLNKQPTTKDRIVGGLGAAGGMLVLSGIILYFVPMYSRQSDALLLIIGVPLLAAAVLVWRTNKH
jgi:hypothetical protein